MKRLLDIFVASAALILLSPVLLLASVLVKLGGGPVFFKQDRLGEGAQIFSIFKLRTMIVDADRYLDVDGRPTRERVTKVGRVLRKLSIDEFPQFLNILVGDMSLIGPRPILPLMLPYLSERERKRFSVRPGITGLAQVKGRNNLKWSRRFHYDVIYIRRSSPALDFWIVGQTMKILFFGHGVAHDRNSGQVNDITTRYLSQSRAT